MVQFRVQGIFALALVISLIGISPSFANHPDDLNANGLKERGDGSIDDTQPNGVSDNDNLDLNGIKRRGDGSIDDTQPGTEKNVGRVNEDRGVRDHGRGRGRGKGRGRGHGGDIHGDRQEGRRDGRQEGRRDGRQEGRRDGRQEGRRDGRQEGPRSD